MSDTIPVLCRNGRGYSVHIVQNGPALGYIENGPNMRPWGWTVGFGWHTGLPTLGVALDALLADPAFGVNL